MRPLLTRLRGDARGAATVEFALWCTTFFFMIMGAIDFGSYFLLRGKMNEAVSAAAVSSFKTPDNVTFTSLQGFVQGVTGDAAVSVSAICNGSANACTNLSRTCACLKTDGSFTAAACGTTCTGTSYTSGSTAGYYLKIKATRSYSPVILPQDALTPATIVQSATVRLQ